MALVKALKILMDSDSVRSNVRSPGRRQAEPPPGTPDPLTQVKLRKKWRRKEKIAAGLF